MQIVVRYGVFDGMVAEFIGGAVNVAATETTAGKPHAEAVGIVIAAIFVGPGIVLDNWQAAGSEERMLPW